MTETILAARNVVVNFGGFKALNGVNLSVDKGEIRGLIGPNGAGKTTFFRCLSGIQRPTSGEVLLRSRNIAGWNRSAIARVGVGIKTQVPSLFDGLTAAESLWLSLRTIRDEKQRKQKIANVVEKIGIADVLYHVVGQLAHGQRQLVELAMVVASEPELILLDEPAAGMTKIEVDRMASLILGLRQRHTVIVVEHDIGFIRRIADRVTVFHQGQVLVEGQAEKVLSDEAVRRVYLGNKNVQ